MSTLSWIIIFTGLGGVLSALAAGVFLLVSAPQARCLLPHLISFATGTLLGAALLGLLPHALEGGGPLEHRTRSVSRCWPASCCSSCWRSSCSGGTATTHDCEIAFATPGRA